MGSNARTVLGLDPGSRRTGFGILSRPRGDSGLVRLASGTLRLDVDRPFAERLPELHRELAAIIREHSPGEAALETCFLSRGVRAALVLGHIRGVLLMICLEAGMTVHEYSPAEVKRALTGNGAAPKPQVKTMMKRLLSNPPADPGEDEADALAIAYCHLTRPPIPTNAGLRYER